MCARVLVALAVYDAFRRLPVRPGTGLPQAFRASTGTGHADINLLTSATSSNELDFVGGTTDDQLWFARSGNDLQIDLMGTSTQVTLENWFASSNQPLPEITAGSLKLDSQMSQLVQVKATYSAANPEFDPTASGIDIVPASWRGRRSGTPETRRGSPTRSALRLCDDHASPPQWTTAFCSAGPGGTATPRPAAAGTFSGRVASARPVESLIDFIVAKAMTYPIVIQ
jgi:hypothetical protein